MALVLLLILLPLSANASDRATILCYHEVDPADAPSHETIPRRSATVANESERLRYTVTTESFREQLDLLQKSGATVIPLSDLVDYLAGRRSTLPPRPVVITVDDGWSCAAREIAPELGRRSLPFTLFVYPAIVGRGSHAVTWSDVEAMARAGVDIESHTWSHPFLTLANNTRLSSDEYPTFLDHELRDSRKVIESHTGKPVRFLSYPYGDFDDAVVAAATAAGYEAAVTTWRGSVQPDDGSMDLKRQLVHRDTTLEEFASWLP